MSEKVVVITRLAAPSPEARQEVIEKLQDAFKDIHAVLIPRQDDQKTIWTVEEYANDAALTTHASLQAVKDLDAWLKSNSIYSAAQGPDFEVLRYITDDFHFSRPGVLSHADPHVVYAELDYVPGGVDTATPYWKAVVETGRDDEPGTLKYGVLKDPQRPEKLFTFEVYESPEYLKDKHVPSEAVQQNIANTKHLRTGLKHSMLRLVYGALHV